MKIGDFVTCNIKHKYTCLHMSSEKYPNGYAEIMYIIENSAYLCGPYGNIGTRGLKDLTIIEDINL